MSSFLRTMFYITSGSASVFAAIIYIKDRIVPRYEGKENLIGKTAVITGASNGIGLSVASELAKRGAKVIMACRDENLCIYHRRKIAKDTKNQNVFCSKLNLASMNSILNFTNRIKEKNLNIDILINNAAEMRCPKRYTEEGFEMQLGVNHLGHFYLTNLLLDKIKAAAPSRIINVTCTSYKKGSINFDDLNSDEKYKPNTAYNQSKLANLLFTKELAKRLKGTQVYVYAVNPGITKTKLTRHMGFYNSFISGTLVVPFLFLFERSPIQGAQVILRCALSQDLAKEEASGKYYVDMKEEVCTDLANDPVLAKKLWLVSEKWTIDRNK